jgi:ATP-dependent helicase/DNAse subunit B
MPEYSISQLSTFEECALQYRLIYVDRIKRYEEWIEAFLGQRFHEAMEWLYRERAFRVVPLEGLRCEIAGLIDRIEAEREFAPHESALCNWCPYWDLCPIKKHLVKVEGLPTD